MNAPSTNLVDSELPPEWNRFVSDEPVEITAILRRIKEAGTLVSLKCGTDDALLLSVILAVDRERLLLDCGKDEQTNRAALDEGSLHAATRDGRVQVRFALQHVAWAEHEGRGAFVAPLPTRVLRLQRRADYRLTTPLADPPMCRGVLPGGERLATRICDISGSGVAIISPPSGAQLAPGQRLEHCRIELPDLGLVSVTLEIRNCFDVEQRDGKKSRRCGCVFVAPSSGVVAMIQRYIMKVERDQRAMFSTHF